MKNPTFQRDKEGSLHLSPCHATEALSLKLSLFTSVCNLCFFSPHNSFSHLPSFLVGAARARSEWLLNGVYRPDCMLHGTSCKIIETRIAPL